MNIKTIKNFIAFLVVVAFVGVSSPAQAYVPGVWDPTPRVNMNESAFTIVPSTVNNAPIAYQTPAQPINGTNNSVTQVGYFGGSNTNATPANTTTNNTTTNTTTKTVSTTATPAKVRQTTNTTEYNPSYSNQLRPVVTTPVDNNGLTALSVAGSGGFMPSSVFQWILVILFILAIIIIARMLGRTNHHEVHTVTSH